MSIGTCLLCFAVNVKIFNIKDTHLQSVYEEITDSKTQDDLYCLCYICRARLQRCYHLVKQIHNDQKSPQDDNEIEHKSLVQFSTLKMENTSIPDHCATIKQEPDVKEEISDDLNKEDVEDNPKDIKCESINTDEQSLKMENTSIPFHFVTIKQEPDVKEEIANDLNHGVMEHNTINYDLTEAEDILYVYRFKHKTRTGDKPYRCDICDKSFPDQSHLKAHTTTHTGDKPYTCDICEKRFSQKSYLKIHKRIHTGDKPYCCDICDKKFNRRSDLSKHMKAHTGDKPYTCNICDKAFNESGNLKRHRKMHTDDKPYSCDICNKKFNQKRYLEIHKVTHTGDKPFVCDICDKKFSESSNLRRHKKVHTGDKPYSCDICDKKFNQRRYLKIHNRTHK